MSATETAQLPLRVLLQVRDGVPNLIHEFTVEGRDERPLPDGHPDKAAGATKSHAIHTLDIIEGFGHALRKLVVEHREIQRRNGHSKEDQVKTDLWILEMLAAVGSPS
jgi:hypothetical protein